MNLDTPLHIKESQHFPSGGMHDFVDRSAVFNFGIGQAVSMLEKRGQVSAGYVTVLIDGGGQHGASVLAVPGRVIRAAPKKRDAKWDARYNHGPTPKGR
jgi:hypothetical protein